MRQGRRRVGPHAGTHLEPELQRPPLRAVLDLLGHEPGVLRHREAPEADLPAQHHERGDAEQRRTHRRRNQRLRQRAEHRGDARHEQGPQQEAPAEPAENGFAAPDRRAQQERRVVASSGAGVGEPGRTPGRDREQRTGRGGTRHGERDTGAHDAEQRERRRERMQRPRGLRPRTVGPRTSGRARSGDASWVSSPLSSSSTLSSGSSGIGLASSCWVSAQAAMVMPVYSVPSSYVAVVMASEQRYALPPPGVAAVAVGGQPRRVELHPAVGEGALAVVAALARVGAALPSAVAGGLAALLPVVGLLVVGGGLAGAVLGPVRRGRRGLPPRQVPVERHERGWPRPRAPGHAGRCAGWAGTRAGAPRRRWAGRVRVGRRWWGSP